MNEWDMKPGEPERWYSRFRAFYLIQGPERTVEEAYRQWLASSTKNIKSIRPTPGWRHIARDWRWKERAAAWDESNRAKALKETQDEIVEMHKRHINASLGLQNVAFKKIKKIIGDPDQGDPGEWDGLSPGQALMFLRQGVDMELRARGEPTEITEQKMSGLLAQVGLTDILEMDEQELDEQIARYRKLDARLASAGQAAAGRVDGGEDSTAGDGAEEDSAEGEG